jgi:hypothetical protein
MGDVAADLAAQGRALQVRVTEVEADEDSRPVDVLDDVLQSDAASVLRSALARCGNAKRLGSGLRSRVRSARKSQ